MSMGAGLCFGPLIGSLVYNFLNYVNTFYFFTAYMLIFGTFAVWFIPSRVNRSELQQQQNGETSPDAGITYF